MKKVLYLSILFIFLVPLLVFAEDDKKYNYYLEELSIEGYTIDFDKHQSIYSIEVPMEVSSVKVNAVAESSKAKVEITGADNLVDEKSKIIITVTAENNEEKKYIVNVTKIKEEKKEKDSSFEITKDQKKVALIFAGIVAGLGIIIYIIIRLRDRKIEKGMNKW